MHKTPIIVSLFVAVLLLFGACIPAQEPGQPSYEEVSFQLSSDTTPGNTDEYDSHSFDIYLERQQELTLDFYAEGAAAMVSVVTPSEERLGYETSDGCAGNIKDTGLGHLQERKTKSAAEGHFKYTAPETGSYAITVKSASPKAEIDVLV